MNFQKHFHSFNVDDVAYLLSFFDYFIAETHECIFIQISRETMLLLINNLHKNVDIVVLTYAFMANIPRAKFSWLYYITLCNANSLKIPLNYVIFVSLV
jgi:hypothetical protein